MRCKVCGYPCAHYVVSRKVHWKGRGKFEEGGHAPREDFRVKCPKCGAEYEDDSTREIEATPKEVEEKQGIKMKYD